MIVFMISSLLYAALVPHTAHAPSATTNWVEIQKGAHILRAERAGTGFDAKPEWKITRVDSKPALDPRANSNVINKTLDLLGALRPVTANAAQAGPAPFAVVSTNQGTVEFFEGTAPKQVLAAFFSAAHSQRQYALIRSPLADLLQENKLSHWRASTLLNARLDDIQSFSSQGPACRTLRLDRDGENFDLNHALQGLATFPIQNRIERAAVASKPDCTLQIATLSGSETLWIAARDGALTARDSAFPQVSFQLTKDFYRKTGLLRAEKRAAAGKSPIH